MTTTQRHGGLDAGPLPSLEARKRKQQKPFCSFPLTRLPLHARHRPALADTDRDRRTATKHAAGHVTPTDHNPGGTCSVKTAERTRDKLTLAEVCDELGISRSTFYGWRAK
ncbi:helix-turn-helix domain-containing protein [Actinoallomurus vinaceus]